MKMLNPNMPTQELLLHMGELTSNEIRVARAAIAWANRVAEEKIGLSIVRGLFENKDKCTVEERLL